MQIVQQFAYVSLFTGNALCKLFCHGYYTTH
eukprot:COSAG06_NODE_35776_length_455_cov_4.022472_1_plen_30_part_01